MATVNIDGLDKAAVLAALYNRASPQGMGFLHYNPAPMSLEEANELLGIGDDLTQMFPSVRRFGSELYFDYLKGRAMKISLARNEVNTDGYNRDNGPGAAESVIAALRQTGQTTNDRLEAEQALQTQQKVYAALGALEEETTVKTSPNVVSFSFGLPRNEGVEESLERAQTAVADSLSRTIFGLK